MGEVIPLNGSRTQAAIWRCPCGNLSFLVLSTGFLVCAACETVSAPPWANVPHRGEWVLPKTDDDGLPPH